MDCKKIRIAKWCQCWESCIRFTGDSIRYTRGSTSVVGEGIYRLASSDTVWKVKNSGLNTLGVSSLGADQKNNIIYAGTYKEGAYRFRDTDTMWQHIDTTSLTDGHLTCFLVDTLNGYTYAGTWSGIFRSTNFGTTWARLGNSTTFIVMTMAINSKGYIFAGSSNYGVFRSTNNGIDWVPKNPVMMDSLATNIVVNSKDIVYANTQGGIFSSTNNGDSWTALSGNLRRTTYLGLDADQYLYAGTNAGSIYRTISSTATGVSVDLSLEVVGYRLDNNYPNPFNPVTTIAFDVPKSTYVSLIIYDCLGRYVATVANRKYISGHHEERFDASKQSSGIYFYKLQAGSYTSVKKMVVIK
ncbi:MAG: T9SS type A sorting domain-containing protein [Bacteroidota bacterium]